MRIAIIGAGMAGLACADGLVAQGHAVSLFDKARGAGGRMSTRRIDTPLGELSLDHGAQYFTARDPVFRRQVEAWLAQGVVVPWPAAAPDAFIGTPGMSAVVKAMARVQAVRWNQAVDALERREGCWRVGVGAAVHDGFDAVLLAVPAEQAVPLLRPHDPGLADIAGSSRSRPCWTALLAFGSALPVDIDLIRKQGVIGWAARNAAKPGRTGPEGWVVQATPEWSQAHLEAEPANVPQHLLAELSTVLGIELPTPIAAAAHRWRYALSTGLGRAAPWNPASGLGLCGDWLLGPRIECAWLSGRQLADAIQREPLQS